MRLRFYGSFIGLFALVYPTMLWGQAPGQHTSPTISAADAPTPAFGDTTDSFGPTERLLFAGRPMTIAQAQATQESTVTMVAQGSGASGLRYTEVPIAAFRHHPYRGGLITIETWDGHTAQVSMVQPMVRDTGATVLARDVRPEMRLWSTAGHTTVMRVRQSPYDGELWHIQTIPAPGVLPLVVCEGLLCGTLQPLPD